VTGSAWPEGVTGLDHTADVGILVRAPALDELFRRAAAGMITLLVAGSDEGSTIDDRRSMSRGGAGSAASTGGARATETPSGPASHEMTLEAPDLEMLLVAWLREILFLFQVRAFEYADARFETLAAGRLVAHVSGVPATAPLMELKGVTYHTLAVRREGDGWFARVVFDV
jgi:SHS2 domain-containing protein